MSQRGPRDDRVSSEYWAGAIDVLTRSVEKFKPFSHQFRADDVRAGAMRTTANFENALFLLGARYSAGFPVSALVADLESVVTVWETWNRYAAPFRTRPSRWTRRTSQQADLLLRVVVVVGGAVVGVDSTLTERLVGIVDAAGGADPVLGTLLGVEPVRDRAWHKRRSRTSRRQRLRSQIMLWRRWTATCRRGRRTFRSSGGRQRSRPCRAISSRRTSGTGRGEAAGSWWPRPRRHEPAEVTVLPSRPRRRRVTASDETRTQQERQRGLASPREGEAKVLRVWAFELAALNAERRRPAVGSRSPLAPVDLFQ